MCGQTLLDTHKVCIFPKIWGHVYKIMHKISRIFAHYKNGAAIKTWSSEFEYFIQCHIIYHQWTVSTCGYRICSHTAKCFIQMQIRIHLKTHKGKNKGFVFAMCSLISAHNWLFLMWLNDPQLMRDTGCVSRLPCWDWARRLMSSPPSLSLSSAAPVSQHKANWAI